jgi:hypothetical protein
LVESDDPILQRIGELMGGSQTQLCERLRRDEGTLSRRLGRGESIHDDWLYQICYEVGWPDGSAVRFEWLKTGELPKERRGSVDQLPEEFRQILTYLEGMPDDRQHGLLECAKLLRSQDERAIAGLISYAEGFNRLHPIGDALRALAPDTPEDRPRA